MNRELLDVLPEEDVVSVIPAFLRLAETSRLAAVLLDEGEWFDLGERESYLDAHLLPGLAMPLGGEISRSAEVENSVIGNGAVVGEGAKLRNCVVWPGCTVASDADLERCVVFSKEIATGFQRHADL